MAYRVQEGLAKMFYTIQPKSELNPLGDYVWFVVEETKYRMHYNQFQVIICNMMARRPRNTNIFFLYTI